MGAAISESARALLDARVFWHLVTLNPDGSPQTTPVWATTDGTNVIVNTAKGRRKDRNMRADSRVALSAVNPENPYEWAEIRGRVCDVIEGPPADSMIDDLAEKYLGQRPYPFRAPGEERVTYVIEPTVVLPRPA